MNFPIEELRTPNKLGRHVLMPTFRKGDFNSHSIDCPFVAAAEGTYYMSYVAYDTIGYRTGLASSKNLVDWTDHGMIIDRGPKGSVTEYNVAMTGMLRDNDLYGNGQLKKVNGKYLGTYHAYPKPGYEAGPAVIGLCWSSDLFHWEIGEPILYPQDGAPWEVGGLYKSWIMQHDGLYYLFYNAKNASTGWIEQTGFATSIDLKTWQRHPHNPVLKVGGEGAFDQIFASDPAVYRHRGKWVMFYFGVKAGWTARESVAISDDLKTWEKTNEILVDIGNPGEIDSKYAHKPALICRDGKLYHFYCGVQVHKKKPMGELGEIEYHETRAITVATS